MCEQTAPQLIHLNEDDEPIVDLAEISRINCRWLPRPCTHARLRRLPSPPRFEHSMVVDDGVPVVRPAFAAHLRESPPKSNPRSGALPLSAQ
jgi:hypothetical protein